MEEHHVYLTLYTHDEAKGEYKIHRQDALIDATALAMYTIQPYHLKIALETTTETPSKTYRVSQRA